MFPLCGVSCFPFLSHLSCYMLSDLTVCIASTCYMLSDLTVCTFSVMTCPLPASSTSVRDKDRGTHVGEQREEARCGTHCLWFYSDFSGSTQVGPCIHIRHHRYRREFFCEHEDYLGAPLFSRRPVRYTYAWYRDDSLLLERFLFVADFMSWETQHKSRNPAYGIIRPFTACNDILFHAIIGI